MDILSLYSKNCKSCGYLDPTETRFFKCHVRGSCPAFEIQITFGGEAKRVAELVMKARIACDIAEEARLLRKVSLRDTAFQTKFRECLNEYANRGQAATPAQAHKDKAVVSPV